MKHNITLRLQIGDEKLFINIFEVLTAALSWEERANHILSSDAQISDFEDLIRFVVQFSVFCNLLPCFCAYLMPLVCDIQDI